MTDKSARILKNDDVVTDAVTLDNNDDDAVVDAVTREKMDAVTHEKSRETTLTRVKPTPGAQLATKRKTATESPYAGTDRREYK